MSIINSQPLIGASGQGGYFLSKSLRFRSSASAYLSRTPASAGNQKTWTHSVWVKRGRLGTSQRLLALNGTTDATYMEYGFSAQDDLAFGSYNTNFRITSQVFRDPSAWYHIVLAFDTTQATAANRVKLYVNGVQVTAFSTSNDPALNTNYGMNYNGQTNIGFNFSSAYADFYLAELNFIDGQALTPSSFGETSSTTGVWIPKKYTGTYGTNGFYLPFTNTSSTSTLGNDFSGNNNTWTVNNISLTSGSTYDSMTDVPTNTDTNTANYCVINPVNSVGTALSITAANLNFGTGSSLYGLNVCSMSIRDKTYFEITLGSSSTGSGKNSYCGVGSSGSANSYSSAGYFGDAANAWSLGYSNTTAYINNNGTQNTQSGTIANGDVFMYAVDPANGKIWFGRNGTWYAGSPSAGTGASYTNLPTEVFPVVQAYNSSTHSINFGQQPFAYTPPSGFKALNTFNLPTPTIGATASTQANKYFDISLYTGNGSSSRNITGLGFAPDFVWIKNRANGTRFHVLNDTVRGANKQLFSNVTNAEETDTTQLTAFNSDGFTVGNNANVNENTSGMVAWNWKANGSGSTNTAGSITSTVSANTTAGFSIVTYTGTGSNATVGHGLGATPSWVIVKRRSNTGNWYVYSISTGNTNRLRLDETSASTAESAAWNNTSPTSTVFSIGTSVDVNASGNTYVAYCFAQVAGYSAFGSYTGNGSTDGSFVFTGFRPRFVLIKLASNQINASSWIIWDTSRSPYNLTATYLNPNTSDAESTDTTYTALDILSNGFKIRSANTYGINQNGAGYIYAAFAESPFKFSNAR